MPKLTRGNIRANQRYLKKWDDYQIECVNNEKTPIFLPISVNIAGGVVQRRRIKVPQLKTIMANAGALATPEVTAALQTYYDFFEPIDGAQSGTPPTPLDFYVNCEVYHLFFLPRDNWEFTDHTQFSVDNIPAGLVCQAYDVKGVFDDNHALLVKNNNWTPEGKKTFRAKYNLHVSIFQDIQDEEMRTDIIIDPGSNHDDRGGN